MSPPRPAAGAAAPDAPGPDAIGSAVQLLEQAEKTLAAGYADDDRLVGAVRHVIRCAADMAAALPARDLEAARAALGNARAAVGAATYAVRVLHDELVTR